MKKKSIALFLACALVVGAAIGGTLAWLTDTSETVTNTFTTSDIDIELEETKGGETHEFKMIPGYTIDKDPKVTVVAGSEDCYLFVELKKSTNFDDYMTYEIAPGWETLEDGVYYRVVNASTLDQEFEVLKDNQVVVGNTVSKADMGKAKESKPTLTVTAYASQLYKNNTETFTPNEAWSKVKP